LSFFFVIEKEARRVRKLFLALLCRLFGRLFVCRRVYVSTVEFGVNKFLEYIRDFIITTQQQLTINNSENNNNNNDNQRGIENHETHWMSGWFGLPNSKHLPKVV